jgi:hypothetical protein
MPRLHDGSKLSSKTAAAEIHSNAGTPRLTIKSGNPKGRSFLAKFGAEQTV